MIKNKGYNKYTLEELKALDYFLDVGEVFDSVIIVPMDELHDSGYRCMKFILCDDYKGEIIGVVGGGSDVVHLDGIGGYGLDYSNNLRSGMSPCVGWEFDCLVCGCLRLFTSSKTRMTLKDGFICSSFEVYSIESNK